MEVERRGAFAFIVKLTTEEHQRLSELAEKCNDDHENMLLHIINVGTDCWFMRGCNKES